MLPSQTQAIYRRAPIVRPQLQRAVFRQRAGTLSGDSLKKLSLAIGAALAFGSVINVQRHIHHASVDLLPAVSTAPAPIASSPIEQTQPLLTPPPAVLVASVPPAPAAPIPAAITSAPAPKPVAIIERQFVSGEVAQRTTLAKALLNQTSGKTIMPVFEQAFADRSEVLQGVQRFEYAVTHKNMVNNGASNSKVFYVAVQSHGQWHKRYYAGKTGWLNENGQRYTALTLRTPVDGARVTSPFGWRHHPIHGEDRMHTGIDYGARMGSPIHAVHDGTITFAGVKTGYGNYVQIAHNDTYTTAYAHMRNFAKGVRVGSEVKRGTVIGYVGMTGYSTGPHLHYEVLRNGDFINPLKWQKIDAVKTVAVDKQQLQQTLAMVKELKQETKIVKQYVAVRDVPAF